MSNYFEIMDRNDFMTFFRNDTKLNLLMPDDRVEIFSHILLGSSDFTLEIFDRLFKDYSVDSLEIVQKS